MQAVIFDLDGTIVFSHPVHFAAYQTLFDDFGIKWNFEEFNDFFAGTGAPSIIKEILTRNNVTEFDLDALVKRKRDLFDEILQTKKLEVVPGFFEFIKKVNDGGLKKIIASGSNRHNIMAMLKNIGVADEFPQVLSGEDVPHPKPAPDIFIAAAEAIGTSPSMCCVIEDTAHGVMGAKSARMTCVALTTTMDMDALEEAGADRIVPDYRSINVNDFLHE